MKMNTMFAVLLLGAAYALCGNVRKRETEAHAEAGAELLEDLSRGFEGFGGHGRSRRSPYVGARMACADSPDCKRLYPGCDYKCFILGVEEWKKWCHCDCQCKDGSIIHLPV